MYANLRSFNLKDANGQLLLIMYLSIHGDLIKDKWHVTTYYLIWIRH